MRVFLKKQLLVNWLFVKWTGDDSQVTLQNAILVKAWHETLVVVTVLIVVGVVIVVDAGVVIAVVVIAVVVVAIVVVAADVAGAVVANRIRKCSRRSNKLWNFIKNVTSRHLAESQFADRQSDIPLQWPKVRINTGEIVRLDPLIVPVKVAPDTPLATHYYTGL